MYVFWGNSHFNAVNLEKKETQLREQADDRFGSRPEADVVERKPPTLSGPVFPVRNDIASVSW